MYSLILDSATSTLYVALVNDDKVLFERYVEGQKSHSKSIVSLVDEALKQNSIEAKDLDKIVIGHGPGSYTGVRMAVAVGKMMAVFMNKPLYEISTLILMASGYKGVTLSLIDARRGNAFAGIYDYNISSWVKEEGMYEINSLDNYEYGTKVTPMNMRVDAKYCVNHATKVKEPHLFVPNYLRDTEAERNLK